MKLTDEQIESILTKDVACKTLLVDKCDVENVISSHKLLGWELLKKVELNEKYKITFKKVK